MCRAAILLAVGLGVLGIITWWFNRHGLGSSDPNRGRMLPHGPLVFLLLGAGQWLALRNAAGSVCSFPCVVSRALGFLAALTGVVMLTHFLYPRAGSVLFPTHSSFPTALCSVCLGCGLALIDERLGRVWMAEVFAIGAMQIALLGCVGHVFGVPELYGSLDFRVGSGMPLHSAASFLVLGIGLLCARPGRGLMAILSSHTPGGTLTRRWLLVPVLVLLAMGVVYLMLFQSIGAPRAFGSWALFMTSFTVLTAAVWATAEMLHQTGLERDNAQRTLELRVRERTEEFHAANTALERTKSELVRANQDLEKTVQERTAYLRETIKALETVCYNIAHDLRAPNRTIAGFAEVCWRSIVRHSLHLPGITWPALPRPLRAVML